MHPEGPEGVPGPRGSISNESWIISFRSDNVLIGLASDEATKTDSNRTSRSRHPMKADFLIFPMFTEEIRFR